MMSEAGPNQDRVNIADRTAIIAAGIAIGVSLLAAPGLYGLMNILIGLALIVTLHAADSHLDRNRFQSASFALAWSLSFLMIAGLFLINPYITDMGQHTTDHFAVMEVPPVLWIKQTFENQAADIVSFLIVVGVGTLWYLIRRRYFTDDPPVPPPDLTALPAKTQSGVMKKGIIISVLVGRYLYMVSSRWGNRT